MVSSVRKKRRDRQKSSSNPSGVTVDGKVVSYKEWLQLRKEWGEELNGDTGSEEE